MGLNELQEILDRSRLTAGPFAKTLFSESNPTAREIQDLITSSGDFTVATTSSSGRPHAALTIGTCLDGTIYFTATNGSLLARNLKRTHEAAFTCNGVMAAGTVERKCRCSQPPEGLDRSLLDLCQKVTVNGFDGTLWAVELRRLIR